VGFALWVVLLFGATSAWGDYGFVAFIGPTILILYLKHPRRKEPGEFDDKLPVKRQELAREKYISEVKAGNVEN